MKPESVTKKNVLYWKHTEFNDDIIHTMKCLDFKITKCPNKRNVDNCYYIRKGKISSLLMIKIKDKYYEDTFFDEGEIERYQSCGEDLIMVLGIQDTQEIYYFKPSEIKKESFVKTIKISKFKKKLEVWNITPYLKFLNDLIKMPKIIELSLKEKIRDITKVEQSLKNNSKEKDVPLTEFINISKEKTCT